MVRGGSGGAYNAGIPLPGSPVVPRRLPTLIDALTSCFDREEGVCAGVVGWGCLASGHRYK